MTIQIKNLTFNCIIGILDFERVKEQRVIIQCSFDYSYNNDTFIDYSKVATDIESIMKEEKFELLEEAILQIADFLSEKYNINNLSLEIEKPDIMPNCQVSLKI